ncbi:MAG: NPCBM/NEW2 domain-containing protein [Phycisphaerae bacterium]
MSMQADVPGDRGGFAGGAASAPDARVGPPVRPVTARPRGGRRSEVFALLLVLLVGVGVRVWLLLYGELGDPFDTGAFAAWTRGMVAHGLGGFFETGAFCDYPPLAVLGLWCVGHAVTLLGGVLSSDAVLYPCLKIPSCLADVVIAVLLYVEGRRLVGGRRGVGAAAIYLLNPLPLYNSAYWGQIDSIHAAFVLLCLVFMNRRRWGLAGFAVGLAMLVKFQSIAFVPLVVFEAYRYVRWRGVGRLVVGATVAASWVCLPFALVGAFDDVLTRAYVDVIGQYPELAKGAYNIWQFADAPEASDAGLPAFIAHIVADGRASFPDDASPLLALTLRRVSLAAYAVCVAVILTLYARRPGAIARSGTAGLLFVAFFLIPTEMHERYALPAIALLALWAVTDIWKERAFFLLSVLLLMNLTAVLSVERMAQVIAGMITLLFVAMLFGPFMLRWARGDDREPAPSIPDDAGPRAGDSWLIRWFCRATWASVAALVVCAVYFGIATATARPMPVDASVRYLSALSPVRAQQGWGTLGRDRSVSGGVLHLGDAYYVRGIGTHATSTLIYAVPSGFETFEATAGVSRYADGGGSVVLSVLLDDKTVFESERLTGADAPVSIRVPLDGARFLTLRAGETADGNKADHVDWAAARFVRSDAG